MTTFLIILVLTALISLYGVSVYNDLVQNRNLSQEGWSGIDIQLKRRADLIPNLLETVKGYADHEKEVLEKVTQFRSEAMQAGDPATRSKAEGILSGALANLLAVAENYPDLKANQNFQELQQTLSTTESEIQLARRYYNGTARDMNIKIQSFPSNIVAQMFSFESMTYFELENPADKAVPKVTF